MSPRLRRPLLALTVLGAAVALPPGAGSSTAGVSLEPPRHPENRLIPGAPRYVPPGERAAAFALEAVGIPYRWGGESPASGFDCSGLVRWAYGRVGIDLPHSSYALAVTGRSVPRSRMEPGDVLLFSGLGHVGLYLGRRRMVHAPSTGKMVEVVPLGDSHYDRRLVGVRRVA